VLARKSGRPQVWYSNENNKKTTQKGKTNIRQNKALIQVRISIVDFNAKNVSVSE